MTNKKPIKRHPALQPVSREHHQGLLLCWKIRTGLAKKVEISRIKTYVDWFYEHHILPHFRMEESTIFPVLGNNHELVRRALTEHRRLKMLFEERTEVDESLRRLEKELEAHIRFEERVLFNEIQNAATPKELEEIKRVHVEEDFRENTSDLFWKQAFKR